MKETTIDKLLNGRIEVEQPQKGYRIAVDTLLLAAAVPATAGQTILDLGCGVGGVMLAVACRVPETLITGVEIQPVLAKLCADNSRRNGWEDRLRLIEGDVAQLPEEMYGRFDHAVMNPPYHDFRKHSASENDCKRMANMESEAADLSVWIAVAAHVLKEGGWLTLIHRADRAEEIAALLEPLFGAAYFKRVCPKENGPARRVIVRAQKGGALRRIEEDVLTLYSADGRASLAADLILRQAQAISLAEEAV